MKKLSFPIMLILTLLIVGSLTVLAISSILTNKPADNYHDLDGNLSEVEDTFICSVAWGSNQSTSLANVSLWTNISNTWTLNVTNNTAAALSRIRLQLNDSINASSTGAYVSLARKGVLNASLNVTNSTQGIVERIGNWSIDASEAADGKINITNASYWGKALNVSYRYDLAAENSSINVTFGTHNWKPSRQLDGARIVWSCQAVTNATTGNNVSFTLNRTILVEYPPENVSIVKLSENEQNYSKEVVINYTVFSSSIGGNGVVEDDDNATDCDFYTNDSGTWGFRQRVFNQNNTYNNLTYLFAENKSVGLGFKCWERRIPQAFNWSQNRTIRVDYTSPVVRLMTNNNSEFVSTTTVNLTYQALDQAHVKCNVYHNFTGAYVSNATNTSNSNEAFVQVENLARNLNVGSVMWGVFCDDFAGHNSSVNATFTIDTSAPLMLNVTNYSHSGFVDKWVIEWNTSEAANNTVIYGNSAGQLNFDNRSGNGNTFTRTQSVIITTPVNVTSVFYNVSSCDHAGNCNNTLVPLSNPARYNITPTPIYAGWNALMNFEPTTDMGLVANQSNADFVYKWNESSQAWLAHTRLGSANAQTSLKYGEVFWLFRSANYSYARNATRRGEPQAMQVNITTGINFVGVIREFTFQNLSATFRNATGGSLTAINATIDNATYLGTVGGVANLDISKEQIDFFATWLNSEQKYLSYFRNSTFKNATNLTVGNAFVLGTTLNITWNTTGIIGNWTNS